MNEKKKAYDIKFMKDNCIRIAFSLNKKNDTDIIEHLQKQKNKNAYLKDLVRKDMQN